MGNVCAIILTIKLIKNMTRAEALFKYNQQHKGGN